MSASRQSLDDAGEAIAVAPAFAHLRASRAQHPENTVVEAGGVRFGENRLQVIAGPCTVESEESLLSLAYQVKEAGATALRGGAYKPRTSPYSFQGHGEKALLWLEQVRKQTGLAIVTEVLDQDLVHVVAEIADVLQIGSRNMQNTALLKAAARTQKPILLKRGMCSTIEEYLHAAEYILVEGNPNIILCERGIRTFSDETRNTFDINAIAVLKAQTHLPVLADPSHATGRWEYVNAVSKAAIAGGADGLLIEVHQDPEHAVSDGRQSIKPARFAALMKQLQRIAIAVERTLGATHE